MSSSQSLHGLSRAELAGHRARLASIRPRVDQSTPSSYYVLLSRAKKEQQQEDWAVNVDAANLSLLQRMMGIHSTKPWDEHSRIAEDRERRKRDQSELDRYRTQQRIDDENGALLRRLQAARSQYGAGNWQSHAAAYEQHCRQVRLRQMLLHDPLHAKQRIREEKEKEKERERQRRLRQRKQQKLSPLQQQDADAAYERDESIDRQEAEEAAQRLQEESSREAQVAAFDVSVSELTDAASDEDGSALLLHRDRRRVDGRRCVIALYDLNRSTASGDDGLSDWQASTTPPPPSLHAFLARCVELDTERQTQLYLPYAPMRRLGKGAVRLQRIISLLGFGGDDELIFKQQLMPTTPTQPKPSKAAAAAAGRQPTTGGKAERQTRAVAAEPVKGDNAAVAVSSRLTAAVADARNAGGEQAASGQEPDAEAAVETERPVAASPAQPLKERRKDVQAAAAPAAVSPSLQPPSPQRAQTTAKAAAQAEEKETEQEEYADDAEDDSPARAESEQPQQANNSDGTQQLQSQENPVPAAANRQEKAEAESVAEQAAVEAEAERTQQRPAAALPTVSTKTADEEKTTEVQTAARRASGRSSTSASAALAPPAVAVEPPIVAPLSSRAKSPHSHDSHRTIRQLSR